MNDWLVLLKLVVCCLGSYFLGSLSFGILFTKWFTGKDLREQGSGNAGATNALRVLGAAKTIPVIFGDALKGVLAVLMGKLLLGGFGEICAFMFIICGHVYPIFYDFRGGKGVMTTCAMVFFIDWRVAALLLSLFIVIVLCTRYISLGSCISAGLIPFVYFAFHPDEPAFTACFLFAALWIIILHRSNLERIKNGTERKFSLRKS